MNCYNIKLKVVRGIRLQRDLIIHERQYGWLPAVMGY